MGQRYKVYFANRPLIFTDGTETEALRKRGVAVLHSCGVSDTLNVEMAISKGARQIFMVCRDVDKSWSDFCDQFDFVQAAGGLVVNPAGEMLFIFRKNKWDLPKGKVEEDEDLEQGAIREVEEECSIRGMRIEKRLQDSRHTYVQDDVPTIKCTSWYVMRYDGKETPLPQLIEGITEVKWIGAKDLALPLSNTYPSVVDVVNDYLLLNGGNPVVVQS
jgi:ADP-ribose pyrophosphatase YjhB (NUDIX family)